MPDLPPLVCHYVDTIKLIEALILRKAPRLLRPTGLDPGEVEQIALRLAHAHTVAAQPEWAAAALRRRLGKGGAA